MKIECALLPNQRMLLQENGAGTKVQKGKNVHLAQYLFTLAVIDFLLHDDDKQTDDEEEEKEEDEEEVNVTNKYK